MGNPTMKISSLAVLAVTTVSAIAEARTWHMLRGSKIENGARRNLDEEYIDQESFEKQMAYAQTHYAAFKAAQEENEENEENVEQEAGEMEQSYANTETQQANVYGQEEEDEEEEEEGIDSKDEEEEME